MALLTASQQALVSLWLDRSGVGSVGERFAMLLDDGSFDVHSVTALAAVPAAADLVMISDESEVGDPPRVVTVAELLAAAGDMTDLAAAPALDDRLLLTDESVAGDPAKSMTVNNLFDSLNLLTDVAPVITAAATDKLVLVDTTDDAAKTITLFELLTAAVGPCMAQDVASGVVGLTDAVQDRNRYLTAASVDNANGTATVSIQAKDAGGNNVAAATLVRFWVGTTDDYDVDAVTGLAVAVGTLQRAVEANAELLVVTNGAGLATITVTQAAGTVYGWAEVGGVIAAVTITITGP